VLGGSLQTRTKMSETVLPFMFKPKSDNDGEDQWLVDEFMQLM